MSSDAEKLDNIRALMDKWARIKPDEFGSEDSYWLGSVGRRAIMRILDDWEYQLPDGVTRVTTDGVEWTFWGGGDDS